MKDKSFEEGIEEDKNSETDIENLTFEEDIEEDKDLKNKDFEEDEDDEN